MFTLLPSLYFVAVHYFQRWNTPHHYEQNEDEEKKKILDDNNNTHHHQQQHLDHTSSTKTSNDVQSIKLNEKYDINLLQHNDIETTIDYQRLTRLGTYETNGFLSPETTDEDDQSNKVKLRSKKPNRSSSLLNVERRKTYTGELTEDDLAYLMKETGFTREQILLWHSDFLRDCPDGKLSKWKFIEIYKQFYKKGRVDKFCEHAFRVFDKDGSGNIDFVEFLIAVSMTSTKDPVRKTELFFSMYDIDQNGLIDEAEMRCVVESIYELMGIDIQDASRIDTKVREIFAKAECDQSGFLRKDQFALACKNDRYIRKLLVPKTKAPTSR